MEKVKDTTSSDPSFEGIQLSRPLEVTWGDCDAAGVVFYPRFYAFFDASTHALLSSVGLDHHTLREQFGLLGVPLRRASAQFSSAATFGDLLRAESRVIHLGQRSFTVQHRLFKEDRLVVEGEEVRVWAVSDGPGRMKSVDPGDGLRSKLRVNRPDELGGA